MASLAKKRALGTGEEPEEDHEESSDEGIEGVGDSGDDDDSEDSDEEINEEITVDFEAHTISDSDSNGIKKLLKQLFLKANINLSQLTDLIIQQNHIGSVIRQADIPEDSDNDDDIDEVFGFISLLNLTERKGSECVEQIKELVLEHCEKCCPKNIAEQLDKILNDTTKPVGLLLSERFINVPPQIALPLHKQLQEEIAEAQRTNKPTGKCHFYIMISKTFKEAGKNNSTLRGGAPKKEELMFTNAEEEFFHEHAVLKFNYSVQEESDSCLAGRWSFDDVPMKPFRTVMLIPAKSISPIMEKLREYLSI
ncbi:BRCA2 and CDKN1A-interacting protein-like [Acipenser ruthenus]|uniref:BRCA2 and CDKN1A-interacting protein-like n=1 Tax=Acipenser ruthenus TaxID=7906 RepID=UPI00274133D2|nr:BRCA2 and CDKN1A-interacting protein-like [Acipenser ruthenus]